MTRSAVLVANPRARRVVVYTWNFHPELIETRARQGAHGYLSKTLPARDLVAALEAVHAGEDGDRELAGHASRSASGLDWPGRGEGLTDRESEILALITQGKSNAEVADADVPQPEHGEVLHPDRSTARSSVTSRTQAVLWGVRPRLRPRPPSDPATAVVERGTGW